MFKKLKKFIIYAWNYLSILLKKIYKNFSFFKLISPSFFSICLKKHHGFSIIFQKFKIYEVKKR